MVRYPVALTPDDNETVMVTFPDFPEAQTFGEDEADALAHASDALATIVDGYIRARHPLPSPSTVPGAPMAELSALMSAKVELYNAMHVLGVTKSDLGRRLNWHLPQVDRLLNLTHGSQVDQIDAAVKALGGTLNVHIEGIPTRRPRVILSTHPRKLPIAAAVRSAHLAKRPPSTMRHGTKARAGRKK